MYSYLGVSLTPEQSGPAGLVLAPPPTRREGGADLERRNIMPTEWQMYLMELARRLRWQFRIVRPHTPSINRRCGSIPSGALRWVDFYLYGLRRTLKVLLPMMREAILRRKTQAALYPTILIRSGGMSSCRRTLRGTAHDDPFQGR